MKILCSCVDYQKILSNFCARFNVSIFWEYLHSILVFDKSIMYIIPRIFFLIIDISHVLPVYAATSVDASRTSGYNKPEITATRRAHALTVRK